MLNFSIDYKEIDICSFRDNLVVYREDLNMKIVEKLFKLFTENKLILNPANVLISNQQQGIVLIRRKYEYLVTLFHDSDTTVNVVNTFKKLK